MPFVFEIFYAYIDAFHRKPIMAAVTVEKKSNKDN